MALCRQPTSHHLPTTSSCGVVHEGMHNKEPDMTCCCVGKCPPGINPEAQVGCIASSGSRDSDAAQEAIRNASRPYPDSLRLRMTFHGIPDFFSGRRKKIRILVNPDSGLASGIRIRNPDLLRDSSSIYGLYPDSGDSGITPDFENMHSGCNT